jgi:threonylcarbamoyladenosine tRNA methylthiotransferase MtaB
MNDKMKRAAFTTLGCKVNQYETRRIEESFERAGFAIVPFTEEADVYVVNTCSVTGQAESKSRQTVRRARRLNPNAKVLVTGCAAQMALNHGNGMDAADLIVPNPEKLDTLTYFRRAFPALMPAVGGESPIRLVESRTRATVKIQDGCDVHCSYCSIPSTRPRMLSRHWREVMEEVEALVEKGYKEVVLTGVLIGAYGKETGSGGPDFEGLIERLHDVRGLARIRISSIEMRQVSEMLISIMARRETKVVPHLHIPLQSGSTRVLRDMNRPYTQSEYLDLCARLQDSIPDLALTTDIMVGFPTEDDEAFEDTVRVCEVVRFMKAHLFRFSPRPGTEADRWGDAVPPHVKQARSKRLAEVTERTRAEFIRRFVGRTLDVLVETRSSRNGLLRGHTGNYIEVELEGDESLVGEIVPVQIESAEGTTARGRVSSGTRAGR